MAGFFSEDELQETTQILQLADGTECERCGLYLRKGMSKFPCVGNGHKKILIVLDCATAAESVGKQQLTRGAIGNLAHRLKKMGVDLLEDCWITRAVQCVTPYHKGLPNPSDICVSSCSLRLQDTIKDLQPKVIIAFGQIALKSLMENRVSNVHVNRFRGLKIPDQHYNAWILSTFSPEYVSTFSNDMNLQKVWKHDLIDTFKFVNDVPPLPKHSALLNQVQLVTSYPRIIALLNRIIEDESEYFYFDYETTGLKPHANGHKILYASFCTNDMGYSFPLQHKDFLTKKEEKHVRKLLEHILCSPNIIKAAHNLKFEEQWTDRILGYYPEPWGMDTLLASHVWDNRRNFTSLKFQVYIILGIAPYDGPVSEYIGAETSNDFNRFEQLAPKKALTYSALDARLGFAVFKHYDALFRLPENKALREAYTLFHNGTLAFSDIQANGMCVDEKYYHTQKIELTKQIVKMQKVLATSFEAKEFQNKYGKELNIDSPKELGNLLFKILNYEITETENGNPSVNKEVLEKIDSEFTKNIIKLRQLQKIVGTYIAQFEREVVNGKMHASFDLNIPISYRSSSSAPNQHNIPIREKLAKKVCRGGLLPSPGNRILEADYSGVEVKGAAFVTLDKNLIKYVTDPSTDMHRDTAADLWLCSQQQVTPQLRQAVKGNWVFPQFYGSWYKECAKNLWEECVIGKFDLDSSTTLQRHLKSNNIKTLTQFEVHCKSVEKIFWGERFKDYAIWKKTINKEYQNKGSVSNLFGFQFKGHMRENDVTNYPIQSVAFHCLLWSLIRINRYFLNHNLKSKIIGQIHDSIIIDLYPPEQDEIMALINYIGTTYIRKIFSWIIVPLTIDFEITDVDEAWDKKQEVALTERHMIFTEKHLVGNEAEYNDDIIVW